MPRRRTSLHRLFAGFAALVMVFAVLAPAIASALGRSTPVMWVELCSAQGIKRVAVDVTGSPLSETASRDASGSEAPDTTGATGEHCPFCHLQSATLDLPPTVDLGDLNFLVPAALSVTVATDGWTLSVEPPT